VLVHSRIATENPPTHIIDHHQHCAAATTLCVDTAPNPDTPNKRKRKKET
jgi:hypothetical protein